jgi:hypothetical protein
VSGPLLSYVRAPARIIFTLALTIILGGLAIWTWAEFSVFRSGAETIVSATALTRDDLARNSLDRVDGVLDTVVGRIEEKGIDNLAPEAERADLRLAARRRLCSAWGRSCRRSCVDCVPARDCLEQPIFGRGLDARQCTAQLAPALSALASRAAGCRVATSCIVNVCGCRP